MLKTIGTGKQSKTKQQINKQHKQKNVNIQDCFFWLLKNQQTCFSWNPEKQNNMIDEIKWLSSYAAPVGIHPCGEEGSGFVRAPF